MNPPSNAAAAAARDIADAEPLVVRQLVAETQRRGLDAAGLCRGLGFGVADLDEADFRVSYAQASRVIVRAGALLGDPRLALRLGAQVNLVSWGTCGLGLMAAADSRAMLELAIEFMPPTGRWLRLHGEASGNEFAVVAEARYDEPAVSAFLVELTFAALLRVCRQLVDPGYGPLAVAFTSARPDDAAPCEQWFACPVAFGQPAQRMIFPLPPVPIASADAIVARGARQALLAARGAAVTPASSLVTTITLACRANLRSAAPLAVIAESIHMTERTLRRRLTGAGLSFASILDNERRLRALQLIRDGRLSLSEVAAETGFADARSLRRAARRWTGMTPGQIRQAPVSGPRGR